MTIGDFDGIGTAIVAGAGVGGGPHVKLFAWGSLDSVRSYMVDDAAFRGGIAVAAGDFDRNGHDELATGRAAGGSNVNISDPAAMSFLRGLPVRGGSPYAGVRLAAIAAGTGHDLFVANGPGTSLQLDRYTDLNADPLAIVSPNPSRSYGIYVG